MQENLTKSIIDYLQKFGSIQLRSPEETSGVERVSTKTICAGLIL